MQGPIPLKVFMKIHFSSISLDKNQWNIAKKTSAEVTQLVLLFMDFCGQRFSQKMFNRNTPCQLPQAQLSMAQHMSGYLRIMNYKRIL